ncbi:hypothetical protein LJR267_009193 [Paraburkholderia hospita]|uniref:hypothetical protein n=1 Tax=Paraburkholderia hospita TaxID=169430 RepID=UPI003ECC4162
MTALLGAAEQPMTLAMSMFSLRKSVPRTDRQIFRAAAAIGVNPTLNTARIKEKNSSVPPNSRILSHTQPHRKKSGFVIIIRGLGAPYFYYFDPFISVTQLPNK